MEGYLPDVVCTKCGSHKIGIDVPIQESLPPKTLDDFVTAQWAPVPLVYHPTTYKCFECNYSITR